jgi:hypothetical protein
MGVGTLPTDLDVYIDVYVDLHNMTAMRKQRRIIVLSILWQQYA